MGEGERGLRLAAATISGGWLVIKRDFSLLCLLLLACERQREGQSFSDWRWIARNVMWCWGCHARSRWQLGQQMGWITRWVRTGESSQIGKIATELAGPTQVRGNGDAQKWVALDRCPRMKSSNDRQEWRDVASRSVRNSPHNQ